jgi:hypothetical protein
LGDATPEILEFVDNVGRYERGEPLTLTKQENDQEKQREESKPPAKPKEPETAATITKKQPPSSKKNALQARRNNQKQNTSRVPPPKQKNNLTLLSSQSVQNPKQKKADVKQSNPVPPVAEAPRPVEKSRPSRGKAKTVCGCFGTKHKALTNCLYCGRISCTEEGYDYCAFCGLMVEDPKDGM